MFRQASRLLLPTLGSLKAAAKPFEPEGSRTLVASSGSWLSTTRFQAPGALTGSPRQYSVGPSYWEHGQTRREQYLEIDMARDMLPHRAKFIPEFTPHGFQLIPNRIQAEPIEVVPLELDSVKRKRRLKMKRHKYKKRMRAMKAGSK